MLESISPAAQYKSYYHFLFILTFFEQTCNILWKNDLSICNGYGSGYPCIVIACAVRLAKSSGTFFSN